MISESENRHRHEVIERITTQISRHVLAHYPTPLMRAKRLSETLDGTELWFKRDDLISFGLGGNKIRGLEVMLADALAKNANWLVTGASVQSNHVRATAAVAAYAGMGCTAVYWGKPPATVDGNYRVTKMLEAAFHFTHDDDRASVDTHIQQVTVKLREQGQRPYAIPRGGACVMGVFGHVLAVFELYQQCLAQGLEPDAVVLAVGSGGTYAGWLLGIKLLNLPWKMHCYTVSREPEQVSQQVADLATEAAALLKLDWIFGVSDTPVHGGFIGQGYGIPSPEAAEAIKRVGRTEGILLDPVYTGKAMAGFLHELQSKQFDAKKIIFVHTGGEPAFFSGKGDWLNTSHRAV
ncbi:D-cysteine desulfhydrase DcyD [Crenothrix polyspora]|uniref:D-cysteine desulfhydrase DcyD n=1 Tax=Crenothrix polyspora TaxID=360316 RepID=A0A1R4H9X6_9GAMM|nr:pyridoxal-phosphate dependent enzyme [Crenothrix polyspora]SJM93019.1 D-cysteine desulfhydrase DcyD [Crenothrix polyspora]